MFREIRRQERITEEDRRRLEQQNNFRNIKPTTDITVEQAKQIARNLFYGIEEAHD